jgi:hypothetical protein
VLARHEKEFDAAGEASLDPVEWLTAVSASDSAASKARRAAIAHCLSGDKGWRAAADKAGGAFAEGAAETGLTKGKVE